MASTTAALRRATVDLTSRGCSPIQMLSRRHILKCSFALEASRPCFLSSAVRDTQLGRDNDPKVASSTTTRRRRPQSSRSEYWDNMYEEFRQFVQTHGHAHVPTQYAENPSLGRWLETQRYQYRQRQQRQSSTLSLERLRRLEELGMVWNIRDYIWEENYQELLEFYNVHGHVNVPQRHPGGLGQWVFHQRKLYQHRQKQQHQQQQRFHPGEDTYLMTDRMVKLSALGMIWSIPEATWNDSYRQLQDFHRRHGHSNVPTDATDALAAWVHVQRREYKQGRMKQERIARLDELNFEWDYQEAVWLERYKELCEYRREYGNTIVPKTFESNPALGRWVGQQREQYKKFREGKSACITPARIEMLERLDFVWNAMDAQWRQRLDELTEIVDVNGFGSPPPTKTHRSLHGWLQRQEQAFQKMKNGEKVAMTEERAKELQRLGFLLNE